MLRSILSLLLVSSLFASQNWQFEVAYDGDINHFSHSGKTMLYRSNDTTTHIFYGGDHLYHLQYNGHWSQEVIDDAQNVGRYISSAVDSDGTLHVSYFDLEDNLLKYAIKELNSDTWSITKTSLTTNGQSALCVDENNVAHIFYPLVPDIYYVTSTDLTHAQQFVTNASHVSAACDNNIIHMTYSNSTPNLKGLWYTDNHDGHFTHRRIFATDTVISDTSIDADTDSGNKAIALHYGNQFKLFDAALQYYGADWNVSAAYNNLSVESVSVALNNAAVVATFVVEGDDSRTNKLKILKKDTLGIQESTIVSQDNRLYNHTSLAYIAGVLRIEYDTSIHYSSLGWIYKDANLNWKDERIRNLDNTSTHRNIDLKVRNNIPYISLQTPSNTIQYILKEANSPWISHTLPATDVATPKLNILNSTYSDVWIEYLSNVTGALERRKYGHYFSGGLQLQEGWYDLEASNVIDNANINSYQMLSSQKHDSVIYEGSLTHSCYINRDKSLFYAQNDNSNGWSHITQLDLRLTVKKDSCAIAVDDNGKVHIAYIGKVNNSDYNLYYITNETDSWQYEELLASVDEDKKNIQIALHNGIVHIGFMKDSNPAILQHLQSSNYQEGTPRAWPSTAKDIYTKNYLTATLAYDMVVDAKENIHFGLTTNGNVYHVKGKNDIFKTQTIPINSYITGIKMDVTDEALHIIFFDSYRADIIYGTLKNTLDISPSTIKYLLH
jgi:acetyltransferase-like isoleucine patch superfamily enzyme